MTDLEIRKDIRIALMVSHEDYRPVIRQVFFAVNGDGTSENVHHMVSPGGCRFQDPFSFFFVISGGSCGFDVFFVRLQMSQTAEHFYSAWNVCNNIHVFISLRQCRFFAFYDMYFDFTIASIIP